MRKLILAFLLGILLSTSDTSGTVNAFQVGVTQNDITLNFPETATFQLSVNHPAKITSIVLEYGSKQQTCGEVIAKAFPQFTPGTTVDAEWTWEMLQNGSPPPGTELWWHWRITDANGDETLTETQTATWLDDDHNWKTVNQGDFLRLHFYEGNQSFIDSISQAAAGGLQFNEEQSGLKAEAPIDIYVYANTNDLTDAILYEPSWTGGQAFPDQDIVIIAISENDLEWGMDAIVHELTHVLVGHLTFSCLGDVPTWLNEGLAMFSEGELDEQSQEQLEDAIREDTLLSLRSMSGNFSELPDKAFLAYSQSFSIVKFLIETYGQDKMTALLIVLRDGLTVDNALLQTYGFDTSGLEDAWRAAVSAQPRAVSAEPTVQPTPTLVPTIVPISGGSDSAVLQATTTPVPTSSTDGQSTESVPARRGPPIALTLILMALCCVFLGLFGVIVLGFIVQRQNRKGGNDVQ